MSHTPGDWFVSGVRLTSAPKIGPDTRLLTVGPEGDGLALVFFDMKTGRGHVDARLIAAAPDMLEAHEENVRILGFLVNELQGRIEGGKLAALAGCLDRARAALAKAQPAP